MNAQEAARMVNSGMEKLSLAQLVEVHAVLKGDENSTGLFRLVSGYARGQLSAYARSSADFQSQMTLEDAGALRELAEEVGFDKDDNLTVKKLLKLRPAFPSVPRTKKLKRLSPPPKNSRKRRKTVSRAFP